MDNNSFTYDIFKKFEQDKFSFVYQGYFANNIVINAVDLIENNTLKDISFRKLRRKLSYLMIESFQNITRYADEPTNRDNTYFDELFIVRNIAIIFILFRLIL